MAGNELQLQHAESAERDFSKAILETTIWSSARTLTRFSAFYSKIDGYFQDGTYTDVNIICQDRVFKCHRVILAAASEYFHLMFGGNFKESRCEDVVLRDLVDSVTFEQILRYVYGGQFAAINDDNVYDLLRASDIFKLSDLEDVCVHYLTQKNIPTDCALELYLFASASHKVALIPALSQFILQHLDRFGEESVFLGMSLEDFSALLTYFRPSSSTSRETRLLNAILRWVCHSTSIHENDRRSSFIELARKVDFKFVSVALCVSEYFDAYSVDDSNDENHRRSETSEASDSDFSLELNESLHVYAKAYQYGATGILLDQTNIFTLRENGTEDINWHLSHAGRPFSLEMMRVVECEGRLYSLRASNSGIYDDEWSFSSSTTIDLSTDARLLAKPQPAVLQLFEDDLFNSSTLCRLRKSIYYLQHLNTTDIAYDFQRYDIELDVWCQNHLVSEKYVPQAVVSDDSRLYIIGRKLEDRTLHFVAYDPRSGKLDELREEGLNSSIACHRRRSGCYHKGRIYVPENYSSDREYYAPTLRMTMYDVAAGRWDFQRMMHSKCSSLQLVSFNNRLFMFEYEGDRIYIQIYDSYLQTWNCFRLAERLLHAIDRSNSDLVRFLDVVPFQSL